MQGNLLKVMSQPCLQGLLQLGIWFLLSKETIWRPELLYLGSTSLTQATYGRDASGGCNCDMRLLVHVTAHGSSCLAAALQPL